MSEIVFNNFGFVSACDDIDYTVLAGRCMSEKGMEKRVFRDVIFKLNLTENDKLLEIASGTGNLSIPISFIVDSVSCCNYDLLIEKMKNRCPYADNIMYYPGNFLKISIDEQYDKILIYSVLHYLENEREVFDFIEKALKLLKKGGRLLVGDLANADNENRFYNSQKGKVWMEKHYKDNKQYGNNGQKVSFSEYLVDMKKDGSCVKITNELIFKILKKFREKGYKTYLMEQPSNLPCGMTREDIMIVKYD